MKQITDKLKFVALAALTIALALGAQAAENYTLVLKNGVAYKSTNGGSTLGDVVSPAGLSYADGKWTMNGFNFETTAQTAVKVDSAATITVSGANTISAKMSSEHSGIIVLFVNASCTINGIGTLTITGIGYSGNRINAVCYGIYHEEPLVVGGSVTVNVAATANWDESAAHCVRTSNCGLIVQDSATLNVVAKGEGSGDIFNLYAIKNEGSVTVTNRATIHASASPETTSQGRSYAIYVTEPDAVATDTSSGAALTWNSTDKTYHKGSDIATDVTLKAKFVPQYIAPVYVDGVASNGIAYWTTNAVPSGYTIVTSATERVTWGTAGATSWYVVTNGTYQIDGGVQCTGNVHLVFCDGAKLTVTNVANNCAGIATDASGSFTIYGTPDGEGELSATSSGGGAGIGGSNSGDGSHITINGGTVTATGAEEDHFGGGAGIGGGYYGAGSDIVINGGVVRAKSILSGAGIGGGYTRVGSDIVINGGDVYAEGVSCGAGIGGGSKAEGRNIVVNGGVIVARSPYQGAGIGGGYYGAGTGIVINGGDITAESILSGAGIGGGVGGCGSDIAINGGEVSVCAETTVFGEWVDVSDLIGSGNYGAAAENVTIADSANVCFNLTGVWDWENEEWIEEPAASPKDFDGFVIMTPATQTVSRVLVNGITDLTATLALTNAVTGATSNITVNAATYTDFANAHLQLTCANGNLILNTVVLTYPTYIDSLPDAMKQKFDTWATTFGSRDPDGVYTNAFLLNVATNDEAKAISAFKITSISVTNENDGAVAEVGKPVPLPPSTFFNGELWYQAATNLAADAVWTDLVEGSYTWDTNTFYRAKLDLTHPDAPTVPTTSEAGRSIKFRPVE